MYNKKESFLARTHRHILQTEVLMTFKIIRHLLFKVLKCIFLCTLQILSLNETSIVIKPDLQLQKQNPKKKSLVIFCYHMYEHPLGSWKLSASSVAYSGSLHEIIESAEQKHPSTDKCGERRGEREGGRKRASKVTNYFLASYKYH